MKKRMALPLFRISRLFAFRRDADGTREGGRHTFHRRSAVLGLCLVAALTMGFWANSPERGRGVSAIRMRVDFTAMPKPRFAAQSTTMPLLRSSALTGISSLALDRAYFRATIRDVVKSGFGSDEFLATGRQQSSFMDALFSMDRIDAIEPDLIIPRWQFDDNTTGRNDEWNTGAEWIDGGNPLPANECLLPQENGTADDLRRLLFRMALPVTPESLAVRSEKYTGLVEKSAKRFGLSPQLIYGIMRAESSFNPFAVSNAGALGLMQLVPDTAAAEVHNYFGREGNPTRALLFDPQNNIEYGSAYLHLLSTRYFSPVGNRASRELCVIAAYNAGPGAVLRLFDANKDAAMAAINTLTPEELYLRLARDMPSEETRHYVGKVLANFNTYPGS